MNQLKAFFLTLLVCSTSLLLAEESKPVKVGAILGLTGSASVWSKHARQGIELAEYEINNSGGINGKPLKIILEDSGSSAKGSVSAFKKLVTVDKVEAVVGDIWSFLTIPLIPLANSYKTVLISPSIFDVHLPSETDYFYTTCPRKESLYKPVREFYQNKPNLKSAAILCFDNTWGQTYVDVWEDVSKEYNVEIVTKICSDDYQTDFRAEVLRIAKFKPDVVIAGYGADRVIRRMKEIKLDATVFTTSDIIEGIYVRGFPIREAEGVFFNDWKASNEFTDKYFKRFGEKPILEPQNSYEAVRAIAKGLSINRSDLKKGLSEVVYQGALGTIDFKNTHAPSRAHGSLFKISKGDIAPLSGVS